MIDTLPMLRRLQGYAETVTCEGLTVEIRRQASLDARSLAARIAQLERRRAARDAPRQRPEISDADTVRLIAAIESHIQPE